VSVLENKDGNKVLLFASNYSVKFYFHEILFFFTDFYTCLSSILSIKLNMDRSDFITKLEEKYGGWNPDAALFGNTSYGDIANDLCYSNSHFSKLLGGNGSGAMYQRCFKNIEQLIKTDQLAERVKALETIESNETSIFSLKWVGLTILPVLLLGGLFTRSFFTPSNTIITNATPPSDITHPLSRYFDRDNISSYSTKPYLSSQEVHSFCPCSGYEGTWKLEKEYKMPLPSNKPGLYYVAKSADVRMKCQKGASSEEKGMKLLGFENIHNEIWIDKSRMPFSPKYFNPSTKTYTKDFQELVFEEDPDFIKIADVYSCFYDIFTLTNEQIHRIGEPCGRYAKVVNEQAVKDYEIDVNELMNNVIGNMTSASCQSATNHFCNPNDLVEGESVLSFDCLFSIKTENLGFGGGYPYSKGYQLVEQNYSSNLLCSCTN